MWPNPQFPVDLVTFTEEILHGKLHFSCSVQHDTNLVLWDLKVISPTSQETLSEKAP